MEVFVTRQPIFDTADKVYGYELLFRGGIENALASRGPDPVLLSSILDAEAITGGKRAFIRFPDDLIEHGAPAAMPGEFLGLLVPNDVKPSQELIQICRILKQKGYVLALDDFTQGSGQEALVELADIIRINFLHTSPAQLMWLSERPDLSRLELWALEVHSAKAYREARELGCAYVQGCFFTQPVPSRGRTAASYSTAGLQLLNEVQKPEPDFGELAEIIGHDPALSYRVLRLVNSAAFGLRTEVTSIKHALLILGMKEIKEWFPLLIMTTLTQDKPDELVTVSVVRARFAELTARQTALVDRSAELFLAGLFSTIDALLDQPMHKAIAGMPFPGDVQKALVDQDGPITPLYRLILAYEQGQWDEMSELAGQVGVPEQVLPRAYAAAVSWAREFCEQGGVTRE
jgi:EAL and modified HD-GYP domain-containing signal transduction protein